MLQSIRVIYEDGILRPLDPVELVEGQTADVMIITQPPKNHLSAEEMDQRLVVAGLIASRPDGALVGELSPQERLRIGRLFVADRPSEDLIDEERGSY